MARMLTTIVLTAAMLASSQSGFAQSAPASTGKVKTTIVQRINGTKFIIRTDAAGTKVNEQGSGRLIWSSSRDSHRDKVGEYTRGDVGKVISGPDK